MHTDPVASLVLWLAVILACAKLGGDLAVRLRQPAVLGEIVAGVVVGNLHLLGVHAFDALSTDVTLDVLARLGVIILLFEVGLESTIAQMKKVGVSALLVATVGVVVPFALGWGVSALLLPTLSTYAHVFVGATLCATSVGITARVFSDLGATASTEARIVLGAAVIDDVQGLIVLAVVTGVVVAANDGTAVSAGAVAVVVAKASGFLIGALLLGVALSKRVFKLAAKLRARGVLLATSLAFCFLLAWAADAIGLAAIVGAFAAGLILEDTHASYFRKDDGVENVAGLSRMVSPISSLLSPVFFVLMGARTDLSSFAHVDVIALAALLSAVAIAGKLVAGLAALPSKEAPLRRLTIGIGMIPRGEVGLIFANLGLTLQVGGVALVTPALFSALVAMVITTTLVTPPLLRWSMRPRAPASAPASPEAGATPPA